MSQIAEIVCELQVGGWMPIVNIRKHLDVLPIERTPIQANGFCMHHIQRKSRDLELKLLSVFPNWPDRVS